MATCQINHRPGSQAQRLCAVHGGRLRRLDAQPPSRAESVARADRITACTGDSETQVRTMLHANGPIYADAAAHGLLPIRDRAVVLRKSPDGKWIVALNALDDPPETRERGTGRTAPEAYLAALAEYLGTSLTQAMCVVLTRDDSGSATAGQVAAAAFDTLDAAKAYAVERAGDRSWLCDEDGIRAAN